MKKGISILIAAIVLFSTTYGICDNDKSPIPFNATLTTSLISDSALEILSSDEKRALLTICIALDFGLCDAGKDFMANNFGTFALNTSYVASDGSSLIITGYAGGKSLSFFYNPSLKETSYYMMDSSLSDELMDVIVKNAAEQLPLSYKNDPLTMLKVLELMKDAIGK